MAKKKSKKKSGTSKQGTSVSKKKTTKKTSASKKSKKVSVSKSKKKKGIVLNSKKSGINTKVAKQTYKKVNGYLASLQAHVQSLQTHVEQMNSSAWYGGTTANQWYGSMSTANLNLVDLYTGIEDLQEQIRAKFEEASILLGIDF